MKTRHSRIIIVIVLLYASAGGRETVAQQVRQESSGDAVIKSELQKTSENTPSSLSLQKLIQQALDRNPEIKAMARNFDRASARIPQAKALPDPMLEVGYMGNIVPIPPFDIQKGDPSSARMISITQEIPFPGKLSLKSKIATVDAESEWWAYEQTRLNLIAEVKDAYFELCYLAKAFEIVTRNKDLLEKLAKIAEARYTVGQGIQQDVLKAQVEVSKLSEQLIVIEQRRQATEARLNSLLYRHPDSPLGKPETLQLRDFNYTLAELIELALANYPSLKMQKRRVDREQYGVELAEKDFYPDFSLGFAYQNRPDIPEMYGLRVGVKIPLWFWQKQRPAVAEAAASAATERKRLENLTTLLLFRLKDGYLAATTAGRLAKLYGATIIPQSSLSFEAALAAYEVGKADFLTLFDNLVTLLNYELSYYEQLSNFEKGIATLEPLAGKSLMP